MASVILAVQKEVKWETLQRDEMAAAHALGITEKIWSARKMASVLSATPCGKRLPHQEM